MGERGEREEGALVTEPWSQSFTFHKLYDLYIRYPSKRRSFDKDIMFIYSLLIDHYFVPRAV